MIRFFGLLFFALIGSVIIWWLDILSGKHFLGEFLGIPMLEILATLLGLNIASATFLLGYFLNLTNGKNHSVLKLGTGLHSIKKTTKNTP